MSTIIVPGGTSGLRQNLFTTGVNVVILYFVYKVVREYLVNLAINKTINIVDVLKSINIDVTGLFAPASTTEGGDFPMYTADHAVVNAVDNVASPDTVARTPGDAPFVDPAYKGIELDDGP